MTLRERVENAYWVGVEAVMELVEAEIHTARYSVMSQPGKCRFCWMTPLDPGPHHRMHCRFYRGALEHRLALTGINGTFGGADYMCSCGGYVRVGGMAGQEEAVCPREKETER